MCAETFLTHTSSALRLGQKAVRRERQGEATSGSTDHAQEARRPFIPGNPSIVSKLKEVYDAKRKKESRRVEAPSDATLRRASHFRSPNCGPKYTLGAGLSTVGRRQSRGRFAVLKGGA